MKKISDKLVIALITAALLGLVNYVFGIIGDPAQDVWVVLFGSPEDKAVRHYEEKLKEAQQDSLAQIAQDWIEKQQLIEDSLAHKELVSRIQDHEKKLACLKREIDLAESDPCYRNSLFYVQGDLFDGRGWTIKSVNCMGAEIPAGTYGSFPLILLNDKWRKRHFPYERLIVAIELNATLGRCIYK